MKKFFLILLSLQFLLTGCVEKEIVDDVNLITAVAFDSAGNNQILGTVNYNVYLKDQPVEDKQIVQQSELSREIIDDMQKQSSHPLVLGKLQIVLFGETLVKAGINEQVDTLQREASISERLLLVVARGKAKEILDADFSPLGASEFLTNLILHNKTELDVPRSNLHLFLYQYYSKGQDAYLPILKKSGSTIQIDGLALFDNEKFVTEIPNEKMFFFKVLTDQYTNGSYTLDLPETNEKVGIKSISSSRKIKLKSTDPYKLEISIRIKGFVTEFTGGKITPQIINEAEKAFEKSIEKETLALIEKFKDLKIDPLGLGNDIRSRSRDFKLDEWREKIPELQVDVKAEAIISETGVVD
jgi:spore germination protein